MARTHALPAHQAGIGFAALDANHAPLRVVIAATRALLHPSAGLKGPARDLAESARRNAEILGRMADTAQVPTGHRGLVDVGALDPNHREWPSPVWAVADPDALRSGLDHLVAAARSSSAVSVRTAPGGAVEIVVTLPSVADAGAALPAPRWSA